MGTRRKSDSEEPRPRRAPARTPEDRENQVTAAAIDLAEKQILAGTASAQVISHYLKLGSSREQLEQERLRHENELLKIKAEAIAAQERSEELFKEAISAFTVYSGNASKLTDEDDEEEYYD